MTTYANGYDHPVSMSDGHTYLARLVVRNVTGLAEQQGYSLYWEFDDGIGCVVAAGPFGTERKARAYALGFFGRKAVRVRW